MKRRSFIMEICVVFFAVMILTGCSTSQHLPLSRVKTETLESSSKSSMDPAELRVIQGLLKSAGLFSGEIDGILGTNTIAAIKRFQSSVSIDVDGEATPQLIERLVAYLSVESTRSSNVSSQMKTSQENRKDENEHVSPIVEFEVTPSNTLVAYRGDPISYSDQRKLWECTDNITKPGKASWRRMGWESAIFEFGEGWARFHGKLYAPDPSSHEYFLIRTDSNRFTIRKPGGPSYNEGPPKAVTIYKLSNTKVKYEIRMNYMARTSGPDINVKTHLRNCTMETPESLYANDEYWNNIKNIRLIKKIEYLQSKKDEERKLAVERERLLNTPRMLNPEPYLSAPE